MLRLLGFLRLTISDYERDQVPNPRSNELLRIAAALETTPEFLAAGSGPESLKDAASDEQSLLSVFSKLPNNSRAAIIAAAKALASDKND